MLTLGEKEGGVCRVMCLGDIVGRPGRRALRQHVVRLCASNDIDFVIANGENAAGGVGIDRKTAEELRTAKVDVITLGDHTWQRREVRAFLDQSQDFCIRPSNYPQGAPGRGWSVVTLPNGKRIGIMNLLGRVFIGGALECPFGEADRLLEGALQDCDMVICDIHAEATSEKEAMGRYLDGRVSLVFGTHTHVQTSDERVLEKGTAYITDLGMCGSTNGVLGMSAEVALERFLSGLPSAYKVAVGAVHLCGAICDIDEATGAALGIDRFRIRVEENGT